MQILSPYLEESVLRFRLESSLEQGLPILYEGMEEEVGDEGLSRLLYKKYGQ